jgi:hypothetical protein
MMKKWQYRRQQARQGILSSLTVEVSLFRLSRFIIGHLFEQP